MTDSISRRAALKIGGQTGLTAMLLRATGLGTQPMPTPALVPPSAMVGSGGAMEAGREVKGVLSEVWKLRRLRERSYGRRIDGFEPSLAALRSVSPAIKDIIQTHRDREAQDLLDNLEKAMHQPVPMPTRVRNKGEW